MRASTADEDTSRSNRANIQTGTILHLPAGRRDQNPDISAKIARRTRACWMRIRWYLRELYVQLKVALSRKTQMVKTEAIEALLCACVRFFAWTLRQKHYSKLRTVHHRVLLRIIGAQRKRSDHRMASYNNRALEITGCKEY